MKVLLGVTGSVATIKVQVIIDELKKKISNVELVLVPTERACHFLPEDIPNNNNVKVYRDQDEWSSWQSRGDPVLHIDLRKWADVFIIAPLDANTLAKLSNGLADYLLTCMARSWDFKKPIFFSPAMNTFMWDHPVTDPHTKQLKEWGYIELPCIEKVLMCNDKGKGAMAEPASIVDQVLSVVNEVNQ